MTTKRPEDAKPTTARPPRVKRPYVAPAFVTTDAFERMMANCNGNAFGQSKFGQPGGCGPGTPTSSS